MFRERKHFGGFCKPKKFHQTFFSFFRLRLGLSDRNTCLVGTADTSEKAPRSASLFKSYYRNQLDADMKEKHSTAVRSAICVSCFTFYSIFSFSSLRNVFSLLLFEKKTRFFSFFGWWFMWKNRKQLANYKRKSENFLRVEIC